MPLCRDFCLRVHPVARPSGTLELGPLTIHMYGLMLLAGIAACVLITGLRWVARGGDWDLIFRVAVWGVGAGIVGARLYHLATSWNEVPDEWWGPFAVWEGGLGIWGGIAGGVLVGGLVARRAGANVPPSRRCRARSPRRAGDRPRRQLVEPGALRQADRRRRGGSRSTLLAARTSTSSTRPSTRRSSTRRSGISAPRRSCSCSTAASASGRPRSSRSMSPSTRASASTSRACAIDPSKESLGLRVNAWVAAGALRRVGALLRLVAVPAGPRRRVGASTRRSPTPPKAMTVPRGRVRPRR